MKLSQILEVRAIGRPNPENPADSQNFLYKNDFFKNLANFEFRPPDLGKNIRLFKIPGG